MIKVKLGKKIKERKVEGEKKSIEDQP